MFNYEKVDMQHCRGGGWGVAQYGMIVDVKVRYIYFFKIIDEHSLLSVSIFFLLIFYMFIC